MIYIVMEGLPPSSNQAYWDNPAGGRVLTKAGKKYKADVVQHILKNHAHETQELAKDVTIGCVLFFGFPDLFTKGWPKTAKSRYKKQDVENRPKLLLDAIMEATAMDDSQICIHNKVKYQSDRPLTTIYIWDEDKQPIGRELLAAFNTIVRRPRPVQSH
jgi:Holliday junction resolvase RusA-like endonuclease